MFAYQFVRDAWLEGTFVALACGLVGWFVVLRGQVFAGDTMSHVAFTGAIAAALLGVSVPAGVTVAALIMAGALVLTGQRSRIDDVTIGTVFSWILGLGILFVALAGASQAGGESPIVAANALFGSIFSLSHTGALTGALVSLTAIIGLGVIARPLLFSSIDPAVAVSQGVPVRALGAIFLAMLALISAQTVQAIGALVLIGLLAAPAGAAHRLTSRPARGLALSAAIAVGCMWAGLAIAYAVPTIPPSSAVMMLAAAAYLASVGLSRHQAPARSSRRSGLPA
jgi:zinc/manganese transport system permease protein